MQPDTETLASPPPGAGGPIWKSPKKSPSPSVRILVWPTATRRSGPAKSDSCAQAPLGLRSNVMVVGIREVAPDVHLYWFESWKLKTRVPLLPSDTLVRQ